MLRRLIGLNINKFLNSSLRSASNVASTRSFTNYKKTLIFFSGFGSIACFDYFARDGESLGAVLRFGRSFKIACQISLDYNVGLYGLDENSEEYDIVS